MDRCKCKGYQCEGLKNGKIKKYPNGVQLLETQTIDECINTINTAIAFTLHFKRINEISRKTRPND